MLYSGFNILPRSVVRSAHSIARSDNLDVIHLGQHMKYTLRDLIFAVAIFGLVLAFYLHATAVRRETDEFKKSVRHEILSLEFDTRYAHFKNSFQGSPFQCTINDLSYKRFDSGGQYEFECVISRRDGQLVTGREFSDLVRPISNAGLYRGDSYKNWSITTSWEIESGMYEMKAKTWDVVLSIEYGFHVGTWRYPTTER